jgi:hypothetical protein
LLTHALLAADGTSAGAKAEGSVCYYICVLILVYYYMCVLILLYYYI